MGMGGEVSASEEGLSERNREHTLSGGSYTLWRTSFPMSSSSSSVDGKLYFDELASSHERRASYCFKATPYATLSP